MGHACGRLCSRPCQYPVDEAEYRRVFAAIAEDGAKALVVNSEPENVTYLKLIVELAEKHRLPAIYTLKRFVEAGGLMSYGIDFSTVGQNCADQGATPMGRLEVRALGFAGKLVGTILLERLRRLVARDQRASTHLHRSVIRAGDEFENRMNHLAASSPARNDDSEY
jgi:hypothetical protein